MLQSGGGAGRGLKATEWSVVLNFVFFNLQMVCLLNSEAILGARELSSCAFWPTLITE